MEFTLLWALFLAKVAINSTIRPSFTDLEGKKKGPTGQGNMQKDSPAGYSTNCQDKLLNKRKNAIET